MTIYALYHNGVAYFTNDLQHVIDTPYIHMQEAPDWVCIERDSVEFQNGRFVFTELTDQQRREIFISDVVKPEIAKRITDVAGTITDQMNAGAALQLISSMSDPDWTEENQQELLSFLNGDTPEEFKQKVKDSTFRLKRIKEIYGAALKAYIRDPSHSLSHVLTVDPSDNKWWEL